MPAVAGTSTLTAAFFGRRESDIIAPISSSKFPAGFNLFTHLHQGSLQI